MGALVLNMDRDLPNFGGTTTTQEDKEKELSLHPLPSTAGVKENFQQKLEIAQKVWKSPTLALEKKKLKKKLLRKNVKLQELKNRCADLLKVEKRCNDLYKELTLKKMQVEVLTKSQTCMQHQVDNSERKHTMDLTLLVRTLEKSKVDLGSQHKLIEILVQDLQKMKSTFEYCKDELFVKDERVSILEADLKKAKDNLHKSTGKVVGTVPSKIHQTQASSLHTLSKRKYSRPHWQPLPIAVRNHDHEQQCNLECETWQKERSELHAKVAKLTQEGEMWKFEKTMLVSALRAAKKEFNHQHKKLKALQEKLCDQKAKISSQPYCSACKTVPHCQCHRVPFEKHRPLETHCAVCKNRNSQLSSNASNMIADHSGNSHIIMSMGEELQKEMQLHYDLVEKLRSTEKQLNHSNKKLNIVERDRAKMTAELAHARMQTYDMEYQMELLHNSLMESSRRLEHVTSQLRDSCHQRMSVQKSLECSLVNLQEANDDVVLENSAKELEFKSMKLLQRLMATRLRWGNTTTLCLLKTEHDNVHESWAPLHHTFLLQPSI